MNRIFCLPWNFIPGFGSSDVSYRKSDNFGGPTASMLPIVWRTRLVGIDDHLKVMMEAPDFIVMKLNAAVCARRM